MFPTTALAEIGIYRYIRNFDDNAVIWTVDLMMDSRSSHKNSSYMYVLNITVAIWVSTSRYYKYRCTTVMIKARFKKFYFS